MKIIENTWQHRNDFSARMECEHCGHNQELKGGYNDVYYHTKVIPNLKCLSCQKTRNDLTPTESEGSGGMIDFLQYTYTVIGMINITILFILILSGKI